MFAQNDPMVRLGIPFLTGMLTADFCLRRWACLSLGLAVLLMVMLAAMMLAAHRAIRPEAPRQLRTTFGVSVMLFCLLAGWTVYGLTYEQREQAALAAGQCVWRGRVVRVEEKEKTLGVELKLTDGNRVQAYVAKDRNGQVPALHVDDEVELNPSHRTTLSPRLRRMWPSEEEERWGGYRDHLFYSGTVASGYVASGAWRLVGKGTADRWTVWRSNLLQAYEGEGLNEATAGILPAMTLGDKTGIGRETRAQFAAAGLSHLLALSGFHLMIILGVVDVVLARRMMSRRWRHLTVAVVILCMWAYAALTGFSASLTRAVLMGTLFQLAWTIGRSRSFPNTCAAALVLMLCWHPLWIRDVGFQLSFLSVCGIYVVGRPLSERWVAASRWKRWLVSPVLITFSATLFTFPLVAFYFGQVPLLSMVSNLLVAWLATALMWLAVGWWVLHPLAAVGNVLAAGLVLVSRGMEGVAALVASLRWAVLDYRPTAAEVGLVYVLLAAGVWFVRKREARALQLGLAATAAVFILRIVRACWPG